MKTIAAAVIAVTCVVLAPPARAQVPDHLKCYKIRDALKVAGTADLDTPQFGADAGCTISRAKFFCVAATKTNVAVEDKATPITPLPVSGPQPGDRICYKAKCPNVPADQSVTDQFGNRTVSKFKTSLLCTPAFKGPDRFVDNGDGTVIDNYTGLQWEQKIDDCPAGYGASGSYTTSFPSSGTFTSAVDVSGTTWTGSATDSGAGSLSCGGSVTGTTFTGTCMNVFVTIGVSGSYDCPNQAMAFTISGFTTGSGSGTATGTDPHGVYKVYAWGDLPGCPHTGCPNGAAFTDFLGRLNGCTTADGMTVSGGFAGHCDWRLPTIAELQTILLAPVPCGTSPCIDPVFGPTVASDYWSSSTDAGDPSRAWGVFFVDGSVGAYGKAGSLLVRAVRGGS